MITSDDANAEVEVLEKKPKGKKKSKKAVEGGDDELNEQGEHQESFVDEVAEMPAERRDPKYSSFTIKKIVIGAGRELHLEVKRNFEKTYTNYVIEMTVDLDTMDWRIEEKKKSKQNYELQNQMDAFQDMKKRELEEYDRVIEQLETERKERIAQCPKISFEASVKGYTKGAVATNFIMQIPKDIVAELNDKIDFSDNYKIELIKNLNND